MRRSQRPDRNALLAAGLGAGCLVVAIWGVDWRLGLGAVGCLCWCVSGLLVRGA